jgi:tetraacyldisaccharide 4'-kinase
VNPLWSLLTPVYRGLTAIKNFSFDQGFSEVLQLPAPVVSVGNLSMGGTGKTPVVIQLSKTLGKHFRRPVIVTRSYRTPLNHPEAVQLGVRGGAKHYGDEAIELQLKAGALVYAGPTKWKTALHAYQVTKPDLLLVDDGFQHRKLHRDFDMVLIDATDEAQQLLPAGRLREDFDSLDRADAVLLTKTNWAKPKAVKALRSNIEAHVRPGTLILDIEFGWENVANLKAQSFGRSLALVSAVGRNEILRQELENYFERPFDRVFAERDHHPWSETNARELRAFLQKSPDAMILTTEKDDVKLREFFKDEKRLIPLKLKLDFGGREKELIDQILKRLSAIPASGHRPSLELGPWP